MKISSKVFYNSLREDLLEVLLKCCQGPLHDFVQVLVRSSFGDPAEILLKRSFLKILCIGACMTIPMGCS